MCCLAYSWKELIQHFICGIVHLENHFFLHTEQFVSHSALEICISFFFICYTAIFDGSPEQKYHLYKGFATCAGKVLHEVINFFFLNYKIQISHPENNFKGRLEI